ncbi:MAG TPA: polysaccharide lyase family 8 super-sandwich domain-containing protein [Acidobacteriaceae bacterium]|jgi:chondroitin AC lyase
MVTKARTLAASQQTDGCWTNVDYGDQHASEWRAGDHLGNLDTLAAATSLLRRQHSADPALDQAALRALHCWLTKDLHNPNWWWNEIGAPKAVGHAALLLQPLLDAGDVSHVTKVLQRANWSRWTGQNLVWGVDIQLMRGLLNQDTALVQEAFARLYQEVRIAPLWLPNGKPGEGIEADGSFHQHGAQLYSGGYGFSFAGDVGRELVLSWNTSFQAPPQVLDVFSHFMLDGEQWMMRAGVFDFLARGREITRRGETGSAHTNAGFLRVVRSLAALPIPRQTEYQRFATALASGTGSDEVAGNRAFWDSDLIVQKRAGYAVSVRMLSTRSKNEETLNGEGMRSVHLADGASLLYKSGQEYTGIFPVWNWNQIPGTTAVQCTDMNGVPVTGEPQSIGQMGRSPFAGEVSDGTYGAAAMILDRGSLGAKKSWFFLDHLYIALGAGIQMGDAVCQPEAAVVTTIEQSRLQGDVMQNRLPDGRLLVAHDGTGYLIASAAKCDVRSDPQTGRWSDIGTGPSTPVTIPVFRLTLDHGVTPRNGQYEYVVFPTGGMKAAQEEAVSPTVRILANRADVQGIATGNNRTVMAVFYQRGSLETPMGALHVSAPVLLLMRHEGNVTKMTASNPLGTELNLTVTLGATTTAFKFSGGSDGGRSETQIIAH